jgi:hypothetical protein
MLHLALTDDGLANAGFEGEDKTDTTSTAMNK